MQLTKEMAPTKKTLFARQFKLYQLFRFASLGLKILKIVKFPPHSKAN